VIDITQLKIGDKVHYQPKHYCSHDFRNGLVGEIREDVKDHVWVIYICSGGWPKHKDYKGEKTNLRDLKKGWR